MMFLKLIPLGLLGVSFAYSPPPRPDQGLIERQVILRLKKGTSPKSVLDQLPKTYQVIDQAGPLILLRSHQKIETKDLKQIQSIPGVGSANLDGIARFESITGKECQKINPPLSSSKDFEQLEKFLKRPDPNCYLGEKCTAVFGITQLGAQMAMDGDLMLDHLKQRKPPSRRVKVAVIDSGFDVQHHASHLASPTLKTLKGYSETGDPSSDFTGHGTAVASLIGGKNGVGLAPNAALEIYNVTTPNHAITSVAAVQLGIQRACENGNDIINLSIEAHQRNGPTQDFETVDPGFAEELAEKGCLVIQSAGNRSVQNETLSRDPEDGWLHVEATVPFTLGPADFSNQGEISAPGDFVFTFKGQQDPDPGKKCHSSDPSTSLASGTSFASPLVTAVASQVMAILKTSHTYLKLKGRDKIKMVTRILHASAQNGTINALRAVSLVENIPSQDLARIPSTVELKKILENSKNPLCAQPFQECQQLSSCQTLKRCFLKNRKIAALCPHQDPKIRIDLATTALSMEHLDLAIAALKNQPSGNISIPPTLQSQFNLSLEKLLDSISNDQSFDQTKLIAVQQAIQITSFLQTLNILTEKTKKLFIDKLRPHLYDNPIKAMFLWRILLHYPGLNQILPL